MLKPKCVANVFTAKNEDEYVTAVNVGIDGKNSKISVKLYSDLTDENNVTSGTLQCSAGYFAGNGGYYTIPLKTPVKVEKGASFAVVAEITSGDNSYFKMTENSGKSFIKRGSWNVSNGAVRVKAYTKIYVKKYAITESILCLRINHPTACLLSDCLTATDFTIYAL